MGEIPTTYLGMSLGVKNKLIGIWNTVVEKCTRRLTNWKSQYLSRGGRLTLVNSVLDTLPFYLISIFPTPASVSKRIDALRRNFFWQGNKGKKIYHLIKLEELLVDKKAGGLKIRNMKKQNQSLMMIWL